MAAHALIQRSVSITTNIRGIHTHTHTHTTIHTHLYYQTHEPTYIRNIKVWVFNEKCGRLCIYLILWGIQELSQLHPVGMIIDGAVTITGALRIFPATY